MRTLIPLVCCALLCGCQKKPAAEKAPPAGEGDRVEKTAASPDRTAQTPKAPLPALVLKPVKFYIPTSQILPPDFVAFEGKLPFDATPQQIKESLAAEAKKDEESRKKQEADWKAKHDHHVTLPAYVFAPDEGRFPLKARASEQQPGYVRTLARMKAKAEAGDWEGVKALMQLKQDGPFERREAKEAFMNELKAMDAVEVLLILQLEGVQVAVFRSPNLWGTLSVPVGQADKEYVLGQTDSFSEDARRIIDDIVEFVGRGTPVQGLLAK